MVYLWTYTGTRTVFLYVDSDRAEESERHHAQRRTDFTTAHGESDQSQ